MKKHELIYIDGGWVRSSGAGFLEVIDAATELVIGAIPDGTTEDADAAVRAAAAAFPSWCMTTWQERADLLRQIASGLRERAEEISECIAREIGQPLRLTRTAQTDVAIADLDGAAAALRDVRWEERLGTALVVREPVGVVAAITPWNSPLHQICVKIGGALAAGCTVVLKPSEVAPMSAYILTEVIDGGLPAGVYNMVTGTGPVVGEALASHPLVDMVSLTGSLRAGRRVMELASASVKRVALELGGKSANIVLDGADLAHAISDGIDDCFRNSGQVCAALSRILVPRVRLDEAARLAAARAESFVLGDPFAAETTLGPVASAAQRDRIREYIEIGIAEGATLICGGAAPPAGLARGYYVRPTVFSGTNDMRIAREEIFGPVVTIIPYDSVDDAIAIANDSPYGLAAGVWAADAGQAESVARRLRVGRVRLNGGPLDRMAPHGGYKQSGIGREWGRYGLEEFLELKSLLTTGAG